MMGATSPAVGGPPGMMLKTGLSHSQNPFLSILGRAGKGVYNAGNFIGGTTKGITQTITETFKGFGSGDISQGFKNLYKGTTEVLTGKAGMGTTSIGQYSGSAIKQAVGGSKYLTQTGGVNLGNINVQNSFYRDVVSRAMESKVSLLDAGSKKYFNSVKNLFPGIDEKSAFEYVQNNGVFQNGNQFSLDFSQSADFKVGLKPNEYSFTGDNINNTLKQFKVNTNLGYHGKPIKDAYEMPGQEGGILSKKNITSAALDTAKNWFASDPEQQALVQGTNANLVDFAAKYKGTDVTGSAGGTLLAQVNPELAEQIKKTQFNITGSA